MAPSYLTEGASFNLDGLSRPRNIPDLGSYSWHKTSLSVFCVYLYVRMNW